MRVLLLTTVAELQSHQLDKHLGACSNQTASQRAQEVRTAAGSCPFISPSFLPRYRLWWFQELQLYLHQDEIHISHHGHNCDSCCQLKKGHGLFKSTPDLVFLSRKMAPAQVWKLKRSVSLRNRDKNRKAGVLAGVDGYRPFSHQHKSLQVGGLGSRTALK